MKHKEQRRIEGEVRNEAWRKLSTSEKLADLDRRLGKGVGARRQRKLLGGIK
jgi:hypothetical protein